MTPITQTVRIADGPSFQVVVNGSGQDPVANELGRGIYPQNHLWSLLRGFFGPGKVFVDLGAHQGTFCLAAAAAGSRVVAVEANPSNFELLRESLRLNAFPQFDLVHAAVSDRAGELCFLGGGPWGHVIGDDVNHPQAIRVPARTLDAILADLGITRVDFLKIDIEGSEVAAINGMPATLAGPDAPAIFYESNGHTLNVFGLTCQDLKAAVERYGYSNFYIDCHRQRLVPVTAADLQPGCVEDYLAIKLDGPPPTAINGWEIAAPLTREEWLTWMRNVCQPDLIPAVAAHVVRECALAPDWIRRDSIVQQFVATQQSR